MITEWMTMLERSQYDKYTKVLYHFNGANGSSSGITDVVGLRPTTLYNGAQVSSNYFVFGNASFVGDGATSNRYISFPAHDDVSFGSGNWTVDCRVRINAQKNYNAICAQRYSYNTRESWICLINNVGNIVLVVGASNGGEGTSYTITAGITINTWYHIAIVRNGDVITVYVDGVAKGTATLSTGFVMHTSTEPFLIGASNGGGTIANHINGYLDEFRVSKGIARWTSNFTPPTRQY